ncbi:hypothetical protein [Streptomyces sp. XY431]|uniref:RICIN domain-containing protein n=1 Tax=Streptomyces sp. XY431 TaxID=1415562 RepID=UPI000AADD4B9|nr:hypothetical protein [Streptomyces sp. XY431]
MGKNRIARFSIVAAMASALVLSASGVASAEGNVYWKNVRWNGLRLGNSGGNVFLINATASWNETKNSDGSFNLASKLDGQCLTSFSNQHVYTEPCNPGMDQTNGWQRWWEIKTDTGWKLQSWQTGFILDAAEPGNVYANPIDWGNSNQRWT